MKRPFSAGAAAAVVCSIAFSSANARAEDRMYGPAVKKLSTSEIRKAVSGRSFGCEREKQSYNWLCRIFQPDGTYNDTSGSVIFMPRAGRWEAKHGTLVLWLGSTNERYFLFQAAGGVIFIKRLDKRSMPLVLSGEI